MKRQYLCFFPQQVFFSLLCFFRCFEIFLYLHKIAPNVATQLLSKTQIFERILCKSRPLYPVTDMFLVGVEVRRGEGG